MLFELAKLLGASYLSDMKIGHNANHSSKRIMPEMLECLRNTAFNSTKEIIRQSPYRHVLMKKLMAQSAKNLFSILQIVK